MSYAAGILRTALIGISSVTDIVGQKIEVGHVTGDQPPAIYVLSKSETEQYLITGASGHVRSTISVGCLAATAHECQSLAEAVIAALKDFRGIAAGKTATIMKEGTDVTDYSDQGGLHRRTIDFSVTWNR